MSLYTCTLTQLLFYILCIIIFLINNMFHVANINNKEAKNRKYPTISNGMQLKAAER